MPATEQTWRDSKLMHAVFGISSLVMLIGTMWMLAADHQREWKQYQRSFRAVETGTAKARIAQQNNEDYQRELDKREWALVAARQEVPPQEKVDQFVQLVEEARAAKPPLASPKGEGGDLVKLQNYYDAWKAAAEEKPPLEKTPAAEAARKKIFEPREAFFEEANKFIGDARFREANTLTKKKFKSADFDVARSQFELAVGNNASESELDRLQKNVDKVHADVDQFALHVQESTTYRKGMEQLVNEMAADEIKARKAVDEQRLAVDRLEKALYEREDNFGKELLSLPIIDAFGHPLAPNQIWLPKLTINYNFRDVARFDRCTTCHQAIDRTAPGSAVEPGYRKRETVTLMLPVPTEAAEAAAEKKTDKEKNPPPPEEVVRKLYGLQLAHKGWLHDNEVTVSVVRPESPAAVAGLMVGDVLAQVGGGPVVDRPTAVNFLLSSATNGKPQSVQVLRGLPNPYTSHPRLDLFVGSLSPHTLQNIGCTICHEGQGSATAFKWASHTPNDPTQAEQWMHEHGWFNNHHWIFPMTPKRFSESMCLKCHHEVVELEPSERFPDPPAPTLMAGYHTIRQYGCFGCHEINGFDGPNRRVGPDLRSEPNYSAAAQALLALGKLDKHQASLAEKLVTHPENEGARHALLESLRNPPAAEEGQGSKPAKESVATATSLKKLSDLLEDVETPGKLRKVGPGLRHVASKVNYDFLYSWVRKPSDFRPTTKMPQFFGLTEHLDGFGKQQSEEFEPIEIRATVEYLLAKSQPFKYAEQAKGVTEQASAERGKKLFETRGCLACHQHADFPAGKMTQGPDLSRIGAKLTAGGNKDGGRWLYSWLKNPSNYHPRTLMPNLILEPLKGADGKTSDPAADLAMYLLGSEGGWKPENVPGRKLTDQDREALDHLAMEHLKAATSTSTAKKYLEDGIPESRASEFKGDEQELVGPMNDQKKLLYVGRRTISKYGCSGCHDIPGYEDVKPIGTGLADWGRKGADKLAFEQIDEFMHKHFHGPGIEHAAGEEGGEFNYLDMPPDQGYFLEKLMHHEREGFIWNKLRAPRSYDYKKTENKSYNERLRMPKFNLTEEQRQQVITFVLGLVAEPPAVQYVYKPNPQRAAVIEGEKLVEKFNCTGCHTLKMDKWKLAYHGSDFADPPPFPDYPFLEPHAAPQQIQASEAVDSRGLLHTTLTGMPVVSAETGQVLMVDEDGAPIEAGDTTTPAFYQFTPWETVLINGKFRQAGLQNLMVPKRDVVQQYPAQGGYLGRLIYSAVVADEKAVNPNAKPDEAWGWLPPPLVGEGRKVQSNWLHDFLLDPYPIRPAVVLRMPKFNMSSEEAGALARYFAASDGIDTPFNTESRGEGQLSQGEVKQFQDALKIVTDNNYCIKCHYVGDFSPAGSDRAKGPHLDQVYKRLRLGYLRNWIANPKRILPYTGMPVNIPFDKPVNQALFPGDSQQQLHGLVDLLSEYDRYTESQTPIKKLIKTDAAPAADNTQKSAQN